MRIRVKLFATLAQFVPGAAPATFFDVELPVNATVGDLVSHLKLPVDDVRMVFVNGRARPTDWVLKSDDEVGIFPPVGGG